MVLENDHIWTRAEPLNTEWAVNRIWVTTGIFEFPFLSGEKMDFCYLDKRAMI